MSSIEWLVGAGRIFCSSACRGINTELQSLVKATLDQGYLRPECLPSDIVVTVTQGRSKDSLSQTNFICSTVKLLLKDFNSASRCIDNMVVKLIPAFAEGTHPLWFFNNVYSFVLWSKCPPGFNQPLKVRQLPLGCDTVSIAAHESPCTSPSTCVLSDVL